MFKNIDWKKLVTQIAQFVLILLGGAGGAAVYEANTVEPEPQGIALIDSGTINRGYDLPVWVSYYEPCVGIPCAGGVRQVIEGVVVRSTGAAISHNDTEVLIKKFVTTLIPEARGPIVFLAGPRLPFNAVGPDYPAINWPTKQGEPAHVEVESGI